jgi:hypothetical protein
MGGRFHDNRPAGNERPVNGVHWRYPQVSAWNRLPCLRAPRKSASAWMSAGVRVIL